MLVRYLYGLRCFNHISEFTREILSCTLIEYPELRLVGFFHKIVIAGALDYLGSCLVLGRFPRHRFLVIPSHKSAW
jgi:small basic protein